MKPFGPFQFIEAALQTQQCLHTVELQKLIPLGRKPEPLTLCIINVSQTQTGFPELKIKSKQYLSVPLRSTYQGKGQETAVTPSLAVYPWGPKGLVYLGAVPGGSIGTYPVTGPGVEIPFRAPIFNTGRPFFFSHLLECEF